MKKFAIVLCFVVAAFGQVDPCTQTTKLTGGTTVSSKYQTGKITDTDYEYEIWSDGSAGQLTYYGAQGGGAAFKAVWNNNGDFLSRIGYKWDVSGKTYKNYGDIFADYNYTRSGTAGNYSYIGIYGWVRKTSSTSTIEWYIVDDWFGNQWQTDTSPVGSGTICGQSGDCSLSGKDYTMDGGTYKIYKNRRTNAYSIDADNDNFDQYFSVRQTPRKCGTISVTEHFKKWEAASLPMSGTLYEAKILAEAGGGSGNIDFSYAKMRIGGTSTTSSNSTGGTQSSSSAATHTQATTCKTPLIEYPTTTVPADPYTACFKYTNDKCYVCKIENEGEFEGNMNTCASGWVWDGSQIASNLTSGYWYQEVDCPESTPSSSSEESPSPILNYQLSINSTPINYYSIKGEPLGKVKPQKAGVYIVKEGSSVKKIVVR